MLTDPRFLRMLVVTCSEKVWVNIGQEEYYNHFGRYFDSQFGRFRKWDITWLGLMLGFVILPKENMHFGESREWSWSRVGSPFFAQSPLWVQSPRGYPIQSHSGSCSPCLPFDFSAPCLDKTFQSWNVARYAGIARPKMKISGLRPLQRRKNGRGFIYS